MPDDSRDLVAEASRGAQPAVEELIVRHLPGLRAYLRLRAGPAVRAREEVSDLAQSVCREVLQHIDRFQYGGEAGFKHWLYATALRHIQNRHSFHRAQKRDVARELPARDDSRSPELLATYGTLSSPSGHAVANEQALRLEQAFDGLSEVQRDVIIQARMLGLSHKEIAANLGRTPAATRILLHRALARLAELLDEGPETGPAERGPAGPG